MSGICGVISVGGPPASESLVEAMVAAAPHRASGGTVLWSSSDAVLASSTRRGAGADTSARRRSDGVVVVADARIDNATELRAALLRNGHLRERLLDVEELLRAAYAEWGDDCVEKVVGDFAFVIWDPVRRLVLAARDPMAMRNLYYRREQHGRLLFATELKQLLAVPGVPADVDEAAVAADLIGDFGRPDVSFFRGIEQLAPGAALIWTVGRSSTRRYWDVDPGNRLEIGGQDAAEQLRRVFTQAVADRLDPDEPTGVLLSGGVDSGSVASAAGWLLEREPERTPTLRAVSWAYETLPQCDERHISRHVVERYGLLSTHVPADDAGPLACWPAHGADVDDPFLGAFQPLIEHSLQAARAAGVGTLLGGDRGDLVIGDTGAGYLRMLEAHRWKDVVPAVREQQRVLHDPVGLIVRRHLVGALATRLRRRSALGWVSWMAARARRSAASPVEQLPEWLRPEFLARVDLAGARAPDAAPPGLDFLRAERYRYVFTPLHLRGVAWSERTYARHGLAFADPFSDRRLVELVLSLPPSAINRPGDQSKPLMRAAMRGVMPEAARVQAAKIVPTPLYEQSLQRRAELVRALLTAPRIEERGWVDGKILLQHFERWLAGAPLRSEFWWAVQVEAWLRAQDAHGVDACDFRPYHHGQ